MHALLYLIATVLFIYGIKRMAIVRTARHGNLMSSVGMLLAIVGVLIEFGVFQWWVLVLGLLVGSAIGAYIAKKVPMTAMPEMVAALNGSGGLASCFVGLASLIYDRFPAPVDALTFANAFTVPLTVLVGMITFTGSITAYLKLQGKKLVHPLAGMQRHATHLGLVVAMLLVSLWMCYAAGTFAIVSSALLLSALAAVTGVLVILPIGGADMPIVVSLLNSYSGIAGALSGFVIGNQLLVVTGALVGSSGVILSKIMCKAMNRSLGNVLIGGIGDDAASATKGSSEYVGVKSSSPEEVATIFDGAQSCIMVPGYGLAVAQAQHTLKELQTLLEKRGCSVRYAIHPVAGRMPGHMNVLLAEADVPYEKLVEMDNINGDFKNTDVVLIVGANDVVNPAARDASGPIAGMPILNVDEARTIVVVKRSLAPGYAGIKNPLFEKQNCLMVFQDAKQGLQAIMNEVKAL